ncbi:MAG: class I SAM-dependent methyltransferase [Anaerolineales bacterium]|nr:class I SAM-dependent methyltransferase [Anaerolineales bacterium]
MEKRITLKPGREEPLQRRHPWIFSGAIERVEGNPEPGDTVEIYSKDGAWIARGAYSPHSQIRVRIWTWAFEEKVDREFFDVRVQRALLRRAQERRDPTAEACRLIHAESDFLPGLVVDRYGAFGVIQFLSAGVEAWRGVIQDALLEQGEFAGLFERSDVDVRELEGLEDRTGLVWGSEPPPELEVREGDVKYLVDLRAGHKTGFYLDQRDNRRAIRPWIQGGSVLDGFCYSGGFAINAIQAGARRVLAIDSSETAIGQAARNAEVNRVPAGTVEWRVSDIFTELRSLRDGATSFDVVILDPPRFAPTSAHVHRAARGYKDINLLAFKLLKPGGRLITFSCSGGVTAELFQKIVADAALDAGVDAQIRKWLTQPADHPVATSFPEGRYLKGLVCTI